jgi:predicted DNA-binding transcriptional regulator YafY
LSALLVTLDDVRADRLVALALLLQARGRMSAHALAGELEVSVRTVYRDISALNAAGIPVMAEPGPNGGCRLIEGYRFPLRGLSADEAEALLLLGVPAAVADLGLGDALAAAQRKVSTSAGLGAGDHRGRPASLVHLDLPRWFHGTEPVPHLRTLAEAVRLGRGLLLGYRRDDRGPARTRQAGPLGLVNKAGTWYLVATRLAEGAQRAGQREQRAAGQAGDPVVFRVGRVTSARLLPAAVARPDGFDLAAFWERWSAAFVTSRSQVEVRVRATATALAIFPYVFGDAGRRAAAAAGPAGPDGLREVALTFEEERVAAHRLAGFGGEVAVISPAAVRAKLIAAATGLLARYDRDPRLAQDAGQKPIHHSERVRCFVFHRIPTPLAAKPNRGNQGKPHSFGILLLSPPLTQSRRRPQPAAVLRGTGPRSTDGAGETGLRGAEFRTTGRGARDFGARGRKRGASDPGQAIYRENRVAVEHAV